MNRIPLSVPNVCGNERKYVDEALEDGWISSVGSYVNRFEQELASYVGVDNAVAVASGSAGLHLAYMEAGVIQNDLVIVPSLTFIATVNPIRYLGAEPFFLDVDETLGLSPNALKQFLENECKIHNNEVIHKQSNRVVRAVCVVHVFGNLAHIEEIIEICKNYPLVVIEDAAEAIGTKKINGSNAGKFAGTFADFGVYSFNGNKIISTGGGGMVVSNHPEKLQHIRFLSTQAKTDPWYFIHDEVGYNYRLTNIAAAIGVAQLEMLENFIDKKHQLYDVYKSIFSEYGLELLPFRDDTRSNQWFFSLVWKEEYGMNRHKLMRELKEIGIETRPVWGLIHEQKPYLDCMHGDLTQSIYYRECIVNIPCSTNLSIEEATYVANQIGKRKGR